MAILFKKKEEKLQEGEWIRVKGYKGMKEDMKAHYDFQYELGKTYTVEDPDSVAICEYGYHFSLNLKDVFRYYDLVNNNRFFKVEALVRKEDYDEYGKVYTTTIFSDRVDKLVAKEITILEEVSVEEMFEEIKRIHSDTTMIDELKIEDMDDVYQEGVKVVLVKKAINMVKERTDFKDPFIHLLLSRLTNREKLELLAASLALYDEIKDRDLLILTILEQKNCMFDIKK